MSRGPITWRNIESLAGYRAAADLSQFGSENIVGGLDRIRNTGESLLEDNQQGNTDAFQDALRKYQDPEALQGAIDSGAIDRLRSQYGNAIDRDIARDGADSRLTNLRTQVNAEQEFERNQLMREADPVLSRIQKDIISGKMKSIDDIEGAELDLLDRAQLGDDVALLFQQQGDRDVTKAREKFAHNTAVYRHNRLVKENALSDAMRDRSNASTGINAEFMQRYRDNPKGSVTALRNDLSKYYDENMPNAGAAEKAGYIQNFVDRVTSENSLANEDQERFAAMDTQVKAELGAEQNSLYQARNVNMREAALEIIKSAQNAPQLKERWEGSIWKTDEVPEAVTNAVTEAATAGVLVGDERYPLSPSMLEAVVLQHDPSLFWGNEADLREAFANYVRDPRFGYMEEYANDQKLRQWDTQGYSNFKEQARTGGDLNLPPPQRTQVPTPEPKDTGKNTEQVTPSVLDLPPPTNDQTGRASPGLSAGELLDQNLIKPANAVGNFISTSVKQTAGPVLDSFGRAGARLDVQNNGITKAETKSLQSIVNDPSMKEFHKAARAELKKRGQ